MKKGSPPVKVPKGGGSGGNGFKVVPTTMPKKK